MRTDSVAFQEWLAELDTELLKRTCCTWADLCGDWEPVRGAFEEGESVEDFTTRIVRKYNLVEEKNLAW